MRSQTSAQSSHQVIAGPYILSVAMKVNHKSLCFLFASKQNTWDKVAQGLELSFSLVPTYRLKVSTPRWRRGFLGELLFRRKLCVNQACPDLVLGERRGSFVKSRNTPRLGPHSLLFVLTLIAIHARAAWLSVSTLLHRRHEQRPSPKARTLSFGCTVGGMASAQPFLVAEQSLPRPVRRVAHSAEQGLDLGAVVLLAVSHPSRTPHTWQLGLGPAAVGTEGASLGHEEERPALT